LWIYPLVICDLHGFVNEQFDGEGSAFFTLLVIGVTTDAIFTRYYMVWLVIRVICASYAKYDELLRPREVKWKRYFTPVYLTIPFAVMTALTHWFMIGIIGVRIYVDNFTPEKDSRVPNTGDYRVAPYTGYMIACGIYLPIVSWIVYIIINKLWFYEVYSTINHLNNGADHMPPQDSLKMKSFATIKDPSSYIAAVFLMVPFIVFTVAIFLPDYDSSEFDVASGARIALLVLGLCFIICFLLANLQAAIIFIMLPIGIVFMVEVTYKSFLKVQKTNSLSYQQN